MKILRLIFKFHNYKVLVVKSKYNISKIFLIEEKYIVNKHITFLKFVYSRK